MAKWAPSDPDREDGHHDVFMTVIQAIYSGTIHDPNCLIAYVKTVLHRRHITRIKILVRERAMEEVHPDIAPDATDLDSQVYLEEKRKLLHRGLNTLSTRDYRLMLSFYLKGLSSEEIMSEAGFDHTQYRLFKYRAKRRLTQRVRILAELPAILASEEDLE